MKGMEANTVAYNAVLDACASAGQWREVLTRLESMPCKSYDDDDPILLIRHSPMAHLWTIYHHGSFYQPEE